VSVTIIVPCFNEAENVPKLFAELGPVVDDLARSEAVDVLFVDDGSSDETAAMIEAPSGWSVPTRVVRHATNLGLGAAVRTGFRHASGERLVVTDADGTYDFEAIPGLLAALSGGTLIVSASPYHPAGGVEGVPRYRLVLSRGASALYRLLVSRRIHTYTSMFRAYRRDFARAVPFDSDGYLAMTEILVNAVRGGAQVAEYPCVLRVRRYGQSKARVAQIVRSHLWFALRIALAPRGGPVSARTAAAGG
jgi:dolichol-phosphate mannosyltransferase